MRITLNLATRPFADIGPAIKRLRIVMGAMALASILLGLGLYLLHHKAEEARARAHSLDGKIAAVSKERKGYEDLMHQPANAQLLAQVGVLNQLFDKKTFSWTLAMQDLETVMPGGVQVSTLEHLVDEKTGSITLRLRVIGPRDRTVDMVKNLEHARRFILPRIVGENAESNGGPNDKLEPVSATNRVNFEVLAQYTPATEDELRKAAKPEKAGAEPEPEVKPRAGQRSPSQLMQPQEQGMIPVTRPHTPNQAAQPGQAVTNQWRPPMPGNLRMDGVSRPPQPSKPKQPKQGGPQ
jgi:type IV pilus assembly protein PilN